MRRSDDRKVPRRGRRWLALTVALAAVGVTALGASPASAAEPSADLSVDLAYDPATPLSGVPLTVTIEIANAGPDAAEDVAAGLRLDYQFQPTDLPEQCDQAFGGQSVVCILGDVAAGTEALVDITVTPTAAGVFGVTGVVASPTPDPDDEDHTYPETIIVRRGPSFGERYIGGTIPLLLERPANEATVDYWAPLVQDAYFEGLGVLQRIPHAILSSSEYRRLRVREAYTRILGRSASTSDQAFWSGQVASGMTYNRVEQLLIGSREFAGKHPTDAIEAIYLAVLRRAPEPGEAPSSVTSLASFAAGLQRTTEGYDVVINDRYQRTFGGGPDPVARYSWLVELRKGTSPERLWSRLFVTTRYLADYPLTEDDYTDFYG